MRLLSAYFSNISYFALFDPVMIGRSNYSVGVGFAAVI